MAFLIVAGVTVHATTAGGANLKKATVRIGSSSRAFAGSLRTTVRAEKRVWQFTTTWMSDANAATLEAAVALGAHVSCSGDALGGSVNCQVTLGDGAYLSVPGGFMRQLVLTLEEV